VRVNPLIEQLTRVDGQPCRGVWLTIPSVHTARLLASLRADWYVVDAEHSPLEVGTMAAMVGALADTGSAVLVRIPRTGTEYVKWALDAGAAGVIAPMVESAEHAAELVALAKYPPVGVRSHGSPWAGLPYQVSMTDYRRIANTQTLCLAQIETLRGFEVARDIAATPNLDGLFVGSVDLAISLDAHGYPGTVESAIIELAHIAQLRSLPIGIFCRTPREASQRIEQGYRLVIVATDVLALMDTVTEALRWRP
jgi:4-hydroxy-2-oxoheptanedioate aldolase